MIMMRRWIDCTFRSANILSAGRRRSPRLEFSAVSAILLVNDRNNESFVQNIRPFSSSTHNKYSNRSTVLHVIRPKTSNCSSKIFTNSFSTSKNAHFWFIPKDSAALAVYLRSNQNYKNLLFQSDCHPVSHPAVVEFINVSLSTPDSPVTDAKYEIQVKAVLSSLTELTDSELLQVLSHWANFPRPQSTKDEEYNAFWKVIDEECIKRAVKRKNWKCDVNFQMAELWYNLALAQLSNFHWMFIKTNIRKVDRLTREQLVRLCFCLSLVKSFPESISMYDLEYNIPRILVSPPKSDDADDDTNYSKNKQPPISSDEIAIICNAFARIKVPIRSKPLISNLLQIIAQESESISSSTLSTIFKALRLSSHLGIENDIDSFFNVITPQVQRLDITACSSLAFMGTRANVRNAKLLEAIAKRVQGNLTPFHVKEIEWLSYAFGTLVNLRPSTSAVLQEIVQVVTQALTKHDEDYAASKSKIVLESAGSIELKYERTPFDVLLKKYNRALVRILNNLALQDVYPQQLISLALSKEFWDQFYGNRMFQFKSELILLDQNVLADVKQYSGPQLSFKARGYLLKKHMEWVEPPEKIKVNHYQNFCRAVFQEIVKALGGNTELIHLSNILPHHQSIEVVFCTNESKELVPVPEAYKSKTEHEPKLLTASDTIDNGGSSNLHYHALLLYPREKLIYNSTELTGQGQLQKRQIEKMGYKTYVVTQPAWRISTLEETSGMYIQSVLNGLLPPIKKTEEHFLKTAKSVS